MILELKSVETVHNAHKKQLLTYLKLTGMKLGYLLNFGEAVMKNGITRTVTVLMKAGEPWRSLPGFDEQSRGERLGEERQTGIRTSRCSKRRTAAADLVAD